MFKANLKGHSGCKIQLRQRKDGMLFVRKTSSSIDYNKRLEAQCRKQARYKHPRIKAPKVYKSGYDDAGLFYFDMEYVKGVALSQYIKTIEAYRIKDFISGLVTDLLSSNTVPNNYANSIFLNKIEDLRQKTSALGNATINEAVEILAAYDWSAFEMANCHGDLTLENILVKGDQVYLIDFLDSFYDSIYIDLGKMLQDVVALWSFRHDRVISPNTLIRLKVFKDLLVDKISDEEEVLLRVYHALLLHLVRIIPYAKEEFTRNYVIDKMALTIKLINEAK